MPVAGSVARVGLPEAGRGQCRGSGNHGADRPAVPGAALLRLAADGGVAGDPRPRGKPQTGVAADAVARIGGDLSAPEPQQVGGGAQDLSVPPRRDGDRAGQPGVVRRRHLYPDAQGLSLSGGHHGLGEPRGAGVAACPTRSAPIFVSRHSRKRLPASQGGQFTSDDFTGTLQRHGITISMDGKGRCMDNIFVERLWRSLKYEEVYLNAYATVAEAKAGIGAWLDFYNTERPHQSLGYRTPREIYEEGLWICGRSALPTGCASPASQASLESGE